MQRNDSDTDWDTKILSGTNKALATDASGDIIVDDYSSLITESIDLYIATTGNDGTGTGDSLAPFASIRGAIHKLQNKRIVGNGIVNIYIKEGTYTETQSVELGHIDSDKIYITGISGSTLIPATQSMTYASYNYVDAYNHEITFDKNGSENIEVGDYLLIYSTDDMSAESSSMDRILLGGWEVLSSSPSQVTVKNTCAIDQDIGSDISVWATPRTFNYIVQKTILEFDGSSGIIFKNGHWKMLENVVVKGTNQPLDAYTNQGILTGVVPKDISTEDNPFFPGVTYNPKTERFTGPGSAVNARFVTITGFPYWGVYAYLGGSFFDMCAACDNGAAGFMCDGAASLSAHYCISSGNGRLDTYFKNRGYGFACADGSTVTTEWSTCCGNKFGIFAIYNSTIHCSSGKNPCSYVGYNLINQVVSSQGSHVSGINTKFESNNYTGIDEKDSLIFVNERSDIYCPYAIFQSYSKGIVITEHSNAFLRYSYISSSNDAGVQISLGSQLEAYGAKIESNQYCVLASNGSSAFIPKTFLKSDADYCSISDHVSSIISIETLFETSSYNVSESLFNYKNENPLDREQGSVTIHTSSANGLQSTFNSSIYISKVLFTGDTSLLSGIDAYASDNSTITVSEASASTWNIKALNNSFIRTDNPFSNTSTGGDTNNGSLWYKYDPFITFVEQSPETWVSGSSISSHWRLDTSFLPGQVSTMSCIIPPDSNASETITISVVNRQPAKDVRFIFDSGIEKIEEIISAGYAGFYEYKRAPMLSVDGRPWYTKMSPTSQVLTSSLDLSE